jgi:hypothetical protein
MIFKYLLALFRTEKGTSLILTAIACSRKGEHGTALGRMHLAAQSASRSLLHGRQAEGERLGGFGAAAGGDEDVLAAVVNEAHRRAVQRAVDLLAVKQLNGGLVVGLLERPVGRVCTGAQAL